MASTADRSLYTAILKNDWSTAKWLASKGKGLDYVHVDGNTILHLASKGNNVILVKLLLDKGADPNRENQSGQTSVFIAAEHRACAQVLDLLLKAGGEVNKADKQGWTPLIAATYKNADPDVISFLVSNGADRAHTLPTGKSALDFAKDKPKSFDQPDLAEVIEKPWAIPRTSLFALRANKSSSRRITATSSVYSESVYTIKTSTSSYDEEASTLSSASSVTVVPRGTKAYVSYVRDNKSTNKGDRDRVVAMVEQLKTHGIHVYFDEKDSPLKQSKLYQVSRELNDIAVFIPCVTTEYMHRVFAGCMDSAFLDLCAHEFSEAKQNLGDDRMVPVIIDEKLLEPESWKGPVGLTLFNRPQIDLSHETRLTDAVQDIVKLIVDAEAKAT